MVRCASPEAYERFLFLLFLIQRRFVSTASSGNHSALSLKSVFLVLRFAFPGVVPRLLLALGSNGALLRSPDRGVSWRIIFSSGNSSTQKKDGACDDLLDELADLMKPQLADDEEGGKEKSTLRSIDGYGSIVAACGDAGYLLVSGDRGVSFTAVSNYFTSYFGDDANLQIVKVLDAEHLLLTDGTKVVAVQLCYSRGSQVTLGEVKVLLECSSQISMVKVVTGGGGAREIVVAENEMLHFSFNGGKSFLFVPHRLGYIRDMNTLDALRRCEWPPYPKSIVDARKKAVGKYESVGAKASVKQSSYEYVIGYVVERSNKSEDETKYTQFEASALRDEATECLYRFFFVAGNGTSVLHYDYSAILCVSLEVGKDEVAIWTAASNVCYIPFSHSSRREPLLCSVLRSPGRRGSGCITAYRGSSIGISRSNGFIEWSSPSGAAPVGIIEADGGEVIICGRRNVITRMNGETSESCNVPSDLRVPSLLSVVSM